MNKLKKREKWDRIGILSVKTNFMQKYNPQEIEKKWQKYWEKTGAAKIDKDDNSKEKFYVLDMFPYPSGTGLHMGHTESYTASDVYYRFKKMQGFNVLHPQGFDAFGLPAENFAIKTGIHPAETTRKNMENYIRQMRSLGFAYDFDEQAITSDPNYYRWTQWIFGKFFQNGLVYKKTTKTNWCISCQTVIANEQVVEGKCERCGTDIELKEVPSWFFKITDFAEDLINDLDKVDWPDHTIKNQRNWIGRSEGTTVKFEIKISNSDGIFNNQFSISNQFSNHNNQILNKNYIEVFTTRVDTIFGCTYLVVAPEHPLLRNQELGIKNQEEVEKYIAKAKNKTELDRMEAKEKTGVEIQGIKAVNPFNNEEVPIFVADYVLGGYGTGAVMAVPAHDERDFEFAVGYGLGVKEVILPVSNVENKNDNSKLKIREAFVEDGILTSSDIYNGLASEEAREKMTAWLEENNFGKKQVNYRLRDWSISRQRYWGCPIPIVYSPDGQAHFVGEENLPWTLPNDVDFVPTGTAPLAKSKELKERVEKIFGKGWTAEYDTMDTFVDSSWYFLRYPDAKNEKEFCSKERLAHWMPVDLYIGGAEHTYMHLLFARFFIKAMKKIGLLEFDEPFLKLRHQGMVLDAQGKKMSKSKGNVVNPDEMVSKFGADSVRTYMLFAAPLEDEVMWNEQNIVGVRRFLEKVWKMQEKVVSGDIRSSLISNNQDTSNKKNPNSNNQKSKINSLIHKTIKKVTEDTEGLKYNTAISAMMILTNEMEKQEKLQITDYKLLITLLSPFAPHIAEELWSSFAKATADEGEDSKYGKSIFLQKWPEYDESLIVDEEIEMVIQVNGKVRDKMKVSADISEDEARQKALDSEKVKSFVSEKEVKKIILVKGRLVNIVI